MITELTTKFLGLPLSKILTLSFLLFQAVLDGYGWLLKDQTSRLPHVNKFLKKVPDYQVLKQNWVSDHGKVKIIDYIILIRINQTMVKNHSLYS